MTPAEAMAWTPRVLSRKTCTRCGGGGIYRNYGICFGCGGSGVMTRIEETPAEIVALRQVAIDQERDDRRTARRARFAAYRELGERIGRPATYDEVVAYLADGSVPS